MELKVDHLTDDPGLDSDFVGQDLKVLQPDTMHPVDVTPATADMTGCARQT
jgi:hypothetical protein